MRPQVSLPPTYYYKDPLPGRTEYIVLLVTAILAKALQPPVFQMFPRGLKAKKTLNRRGYCLFISGAFSA